MFREFPTPGPDDFNEKGELNFRHLWKSQKAALLVNLKDLPREAAIILDAARSSMLHMIRTFDVLTDEQKEEWISVIMEDKELDELLENWWHE